MTYVVLANNMTLIESSAKEGIAPHNLTLDSAAQELLGPGMHQLEIRVSSNTTASEISESIAVHLIEPVSGLWAVLASHTLQLGENLEINVSMSHGAPAKMRFEVVGLNETVLKGNLKHTSFPCTLKVQHADFCVSKMLTTVCRSSFIQPHHLGRQ